MGRILEIAGALTLKKAYARISILPGYNLGHATALRYQGQSSRPVALGLIVGVVADISLISSASPNPMVPVISSIAIFSFATLQNLACSTGFIMMLMGTTVAPYNLYPGSCISGKNQSVQETRFGLTTAIVYGGTISIAVPIVANAVPIRYRFQTLSRVLADRIGF